MEKCYYNYSVGPSKLYRKVLESWESVQAKRFVPLFSRGTIFTHVWIACKTRLPRSSWMSRNMCVQQLYDYVYL